MASSFVSSDKRERRSDVRPNRGNENETGAGLVVLSGRAERRMRTRGFRAVAAERAASGEREQSGGFQRTSRSACFGFVLEINTNHNGSVFPFFLKKTRETFLNSVVVVIVTVTLTACSTCESPRADELKTGNDTFISACFGAAAVRQPDPAGRRAVLQVKVCVRARCVRDRSAAPIRMTTIYFRF